MIGLKFAHLVLMANWLSFSIRTKASPAHSEPEEHTYPRRTIAGVSVVDTPLVRAAQQYARDHGDEAVYKHIMRSWLFGTLMLQHNATLDVLVDPEVHAVATILHALGFDRTPNSSVVSPDRRFEVDGAIAARDFVRQHPRGRSWEVRRVQLVWDAIALHSEPKIAFFKELDVQVVSKGVAMDFQGPTAGVTAAEYAAVLAEFPQSDLRGSVRETISWLCQTKPESTYGEWPP